MATKKETAAEMMGESETANSNVPATTDLSGQVNLEHLKMFEEQDIESLVELTGGEYITFEENQKYVFMFTGEFESRDSSLNPGQKQTCAVLIDKSGKTKLNSQAVLVNTCIKLVEELQPFPAGGVPLLIVTQEKVKGNDGKGKEYLKMKIYRG